MAARWALICSGQGRQDAGIVPWLQADAKIAAAWREFAAQCALPQDFDALLAALHDSNWRFENRNAQPLIVGFGYALAQGLLPELPPPALVAGYSVGELCAHGVANSIDLAALTKLTQQRALLMDAQAAAQPQAMLAVTGLAKAALEKELLGLPAYVAIDNGAQALVLGGTREALQQLAPRFAACGARVELLAVHVASHTPLQDPALPAWRDALQAVAWRQPRFPVLAGIDGALTPHTRIVDVLTRQIAEPVLWGACMDALAERAVTVALELGPGNALARMISTRQPHIAARSLYDFRSLAACAAWLRQALSP